VNRVRAFAEIGWGGGRMITAMACIQCNLSVDYSFTRITALGAVSIELTIICFLIITFLC
jgi:hypothetical protein